MARHPKLVAEADKSIGRFTLLEGKVLHMSSNDRYTYLNFGRNWRTDFTIRIRQRLLGEGGLETEGLSGKIIRVRGFVQEARDPLIDITHLKQIEIIP